MGKKTIHGDNVVLLHLLLLLQYER